ncbi:nitrate- and nitrite sensing domain-containing protein [Streptomyces sp. NBC_00669]|uniref:sensor histidine kinase n=1 Tax=Streptomyces sp. NBC_00669 TaxID=2976011 RepID=UPI002E2FD25D|nr:nitrate- and nitrite sensing domain-containing protein [Streptomyces sp. NBC_00669]
MTTARRSRSASAPKWITATGGKVLARLHVKRHLGDWRLRSRMLVLVLVPLIAIIPLVGVRVVSEVGSLRSAAHIQGQTQLARQISTLVGALDDERDLTEVALNGSGVARDKELTAAQRTTDAQVREFDESLRRQQDSVDALPAMVRQLGARGEARLGDLSPLRASAQGLAAGAGTPTFSAYSTIIGDLLDFSDQLAAVSSDHTLGSLVATLSSIEQIEQQTSSERGYLVDVLDSGGFTLEQKENIEQAQFETAGDALANNAPTSLLNLYQSTVSGDKVGAADGTVQAVSTAAQEDIPLADLGISKATAFNQLTDKLDAVRIVKRQAVADMNDRASHLLSAGRTQLYENIAIIVAVVALSFLGALVLARSVVRPLRRLRVSALDVADNRLPEAVRRLRDVEPAETDEPVQVQPIELQTQDEVGQVARAFDRVHFEAVRLATEQARMRSNVNAIFTNLSRRSESLVLRQLQLIDDLENSEQNPSQLASLFQLDHLATRMRRNNENLLVLAGEEQSRRWNQPVSLFDLVRAATAEVEQYERVMLYELPDVAVAGHAATDVVHLVAELIENATAFSGPETQVLVGAKMLTSGDVVLDIADAGIGIRPEELNRINRRLAEPPVLDVATSRRMGLFVVGRLAAKYGIQVRLTGSGRTGLNALIRIPPALLLPVSEIDAGMGPAFDQATMRPGPYDLPEPGTLPARGPSAAVGDPRFGDPRATDPRFGDPRFDTSYGPAVETGAGARRLEEAPSGRHSGPPDGGFPWFNEEEQAAGQSGHGFSWFAQPVEEHPLPGGMDGRPAMEGPPQAGSHVAGSHAAGTHAAGARIPDAPQAGRHAYPDPAPGGHGSERLPIFESTRSGWPGQESGQGQPDRGQPTRGLPDPGRPAMGGPQPAQPGPAPLPQRPQPQPPRSAQPQPQSQAQPQIQQSAQPQPQPQPPRDGAHPSPSWARPDTSPRPGAGGEAGPSTGGSVVGGSTAQGLPRRVPFGNLAPGAGARDRAAQPHAAPVAPRQADLMRERLSSFHQGVRRGKDGTERGDGSERDDGRGRSPGGSGPV